MNANANAAKTVDVSELELPADNLDPQRAAALYREHGCFVVRGLMNPYVDRIREDILASVEQAIALLDQAKQVPEGWTTPDGTLWLPAPAHYHRDKQVMVVACGYYHSGAFFRSAVDDRLLDVAEAILGPDVELFMDGQCLVKEPVGGHAKLLHQDAAYFEHKFDGPLGMLCYAVDTDVRKGALHVVPGSHRLGMLEHVDTDSHLGLDPNEWSWERALPIEGNAGDAIFFHSKTIHGSPPNQSDSPRPVFIHRYRAADDYAVIRASRTETRVEAERHADEVRKENQRGLMVRGWRRFESEQHPADGASSS